MIGDRITNLSTSGKWQSVKTEIAAIPEGLKTNGGIMTDTGDNIVWYGKDGEYEKHVKSGKCFHLTIEYV